MRKIYYWAIIIISLIVIYFNTVFYLNTAISFKYEVDHPKITHGSDKGISDRKKELDKNYYLALTIYITCFVGIGRGIYGLIKPKKSS